MSDIFSGSTDLGYAMDAARYAKAAEIAGQKGIWNPSVNKTERDNTGLTFEDMLLLMVTQLQNQTIDNQADTNDMMNQLIQMTVMQALTEMSTQVEDLTNANVMSYAASLVGKEVTIGIIDPKTGTLAQEIVGTVTATGVYNGQQVVFIGDKYYPLSSIMAVGTLPDEAVDGTTGTKPSEGDGSTDELKELADGTLIRTQTYKDEDGNTVTKITMTTKDGGIITIQTTGTVSVNDDENGSSITFTAGEGEYIQITSDIDGKSETTRWVDGSLTVDHKGSYTAESARQVLPEEEG